MISTIGKGITVTGTIHSEEPLRIAGTIKGDVLAPDCDVTVEAAGHVTGIVTGRRIVVHGTSKGRLIAREAVRVLQTATVRADIRSPKLVLEDGALFNGSVAPARTDAAILVAAYRSARQDAAAG